MYRKRKWNKPDEEEIEEAIRKTKIRRQRRFEQCLQCRFFEPVVRQGISKKACTNEKMKGRLEKEEVCPGFMRRWAEGITPVELIE